MHRDATPNMHRDATPNMQRGSALPTTGQRPYLYLAQPNGLGWGGPFPLAEGQRPDPLPQPVGLD